MECPNLDCGLDACSASPTFRPVFHARELPLGVAEIAALLGVKRASVDKMRARGVLPEPAFYLSGSPGWWRDSIVGWARATGRL